MAEDYTCPHCENTFKNQQGLTNHIKFKHPEELEKQLTEEKEVPDAADDFELLLKDYGVKRASIIVKNIVATGSPNVFDEPREMAKQLAKWPRDIAPMYRASILEHWSKSRGIVLPEELLEEVGMEEKERKEKARKKEAETKAEEVRYVYDTESLQIRMAKEDERGGTLAQAKELKKMAQEDEGGESPFMLDAEGRWVLNPKARVTGIELMAVQFMQRSQEKGEPTDPITAMTKAAETWKILREGLGGGTGAGTLPDWMTDPVKFVTAIKTITGGDGGDSALKEEMAEMRKSVEDMKEDRWREQFASQQKQITEITNVLSKTLDTIADVRKGMTGRTEMDIIHEIATEGIGFLKTELPGVRRDIKEAIGSASLPPGKTTEQKEERKRKYKQAIETDRDIEEIGRRLFFSED